MEQHNSSLVNLSIPQSVTQPIVAAKIQEAVLAALGGSEALVASVIKQICETRVSDSGKVSTYSSDNKHSWLDFHVTEIIKTEVMKGVQEQIRIGAENIKAAMITQLKTQKGATKVANALLDSLNGTFSSNWKSSFTIDFSEK